MPRHNKSATALPNLGPVSTAWLQGIGVHSRDDIAELGPITIYGLLKAQGYPVSMNLVYALEGVLRGCKWNALPVTVRNALRLAVHDAVKPRCEWCGHDPLYRRYHDEEWGVPVHDDRKLFEMLILEGAQAGLNWLTILRKREAYRQAFAGFDVEKVARFSARQMAALMKNAGIVRNRLKIESARRNARAFIAIQTEFSSFDHYLWGFVDAKPIKNHWRTLKEIPTCTRESNLLSQDLKTRGFGFVGSTICYAFMQAVGMVNDHVVGCYRYSQKI